MIVPFALVALASFAAAPAQPLSVATGLDGAAVSLSEVTALVVDPDERDGIREALKAIRTQAEASGVKPKGGRLEALVIVVDLSDVPSLLQGYALDKMKARAAEVATRPLARAISLSWVADMDGTLTRQLRGPLLGSSLVVTDARGAHLRGAAIRDLPALVAERAAVRALAPASEAR